MKISFNKKKIQRNSVAIAYLLIICMGIIAILSFTDGMLNLNLLPRDVEEIIYILIMAAVIVLVGAFLINIMVSLNLISESLDSLVNKNKDGDE